MKYINYIRLNEIINGQYTITSHWVLEPQKHYNRSLLREKARKWFTIRVNFTLDLNSSSLVLLQGGLTKQTYNHGCSFAPYCKWHLNPKLKAIMLVAESFISTNQASNRLQAIHRFDNNDKDTHIKTNHFL